MWSDQFFSHTDDYPRPLPRVNDLPDYGTPKPAPVPDLPVTFHPTPPRWRLQDWGSSNGTQNLNRVGGPGSWIQDAIYPDCPGCQREMPLLAQLDGGTRFADSYGWEEWTEGLIYMFWCADCRVSAVATQQT